MERPVGAVFEHRGVRLMVIESEVCLGCYFFDRICMAHRKNIGYCGAVNRNDHKPVKFAPVEDI